MRKNHFILAAAACLLMPGTSWAQTTEAPQTTSRLQIAEYAGRIVFKSDASTSKYYRIPSIVRVDDKTLIALCDDRSASQADMGSNSKATIVYKVSTDNGTSWSDVKTAIGSAEVSGSTYYASDVAAVRDRKSGKILLISTYGNQGIDKSTRQSPIRVVRQYLTPSTASDGTKTFTSETSNTDITDQIYGLFSDVNGLFFSSGTMCQSRVVKNEEGVYRIYAGLMTNNKGCKVVYSDDFGKTWQALNAASDQPIPGGNECKVAELPDGNIVLSSRISDKTKNGRYFNVFIFNNNSTTEGRWATYVQSNTDSYTSSKKEYELNAYGTGGCGPVNGSLVILPAKEVKTGLKAYVMLQSMPASTYNTSAKQQRTNGLAVYWKPMLGVGELEEPHYFGTTPSNANSYAEWINEKADAVREQGAELSTYDLDRIDNTQWGVIGTPSALQRGWTKFALFTDENNAEDCRYSSMQDNGTNGIDLLSEESRISASSNIVYRSLSLETITGGKYNYAGNVTEDELKTYAEDFVNDNAVPLPGNTYTMRVRWRDSNGTVTERYLYSDLKNFYDNSDEYQSPSIKMKEHKSTETPNEDGQYYWTIQSDPKLATVGAKGWLYPFMYISIFNGEGYFGQRRGINFSSGSENSAMVPGLTPTVGSELRILDMHHQEWSPDLTANRLSGKPASTMDGFNLVQVIDNRGSRRVTIFDKENGAINFSGYSTQWADNNNDSEIKSYYQKYANKHSDFKPCTWSSDVIFSKVRPSTKAGYGTFERPEYDESSTQESSGYKVHFARTSEAWLSANSKTHTKDDRNYWATLCLPYAVSLPTEVKVTVNRVTGGTRLINGTEPEQTLQMTDITSSLVNNTIPRETPVLLCIQNSDQSSAETKDVDFPSATAQKPIKTGFSGNLGRLLFYDQVKKEHTYREGYGRQGYLYYALGKPKSGRDAGRVALYQIAPSSTAKDENDKSIYVVPKNKAVFLLSATSPAAKSNKLVLDFENSSATGINGVKASDAQNETKIYTIGGQYLGEDLNSLSNGIYIVNGKKVLK